MNDELKAQHAGLKRKLAALEKSGADEAKLNELRFELAVMEAPDEGTTAGPRLIPSPKEPAPEKEKATPKPMTRRAGYKPDKD